MRRVGEILTSSSLAQAAQQDSTNAETSLVREQGSQPVIRVPALTPETALLWQPLGENHREIFVEPSLSDRDAVWSDWSTGAKVGAVLILIAVAVILVIVLGCERGQDCFSFH